MITGEFLRNRRRELGLSVQFVADAVGLNRTTIYRYENETECSIPLNKLEDLARVLCITPSRLMGWEDKDIESPLTTEEQLLLSLFNHLNPRDQRAVKALIMTLSREETAEARQQP